MNMFNKATVRESGVRSTSVERHIECPAQRVKPFRRVRRRVDQPFADFRLINRKDDPTDIRRLGGLFEQSARLCAAQMLHKLRNHPVTVRLKALPLHPRYEERQLAQDIFGQTRLLGEIAVIEFENIDQLIDQPVFFGDGAERIVGQRLKLVGTDQKQQVPLVGRIQKQRAKGNIGAASDFAGRRLVETLFDKQRARRHCNTLQLVAPVAFANAYLRVNYEVITRCHLRASRRHNHPIRLYDTEPRMSPRGLKIRGLRGPGVDVSRNPAEFCFISRPNLRFARMKQQNNLKMRKIKSMAEGETLTKFLMIWLICVVIFLIIDLVWLGMISKPFYQRSIGHLMADDFRMGAAFLFYVFYVVGIVYFCVSGAVDWKAAAINGALFGFFCYATYDMTNYATLRDWPLRMVVVDIVWGTVLTATTAGAGFAVAKKLIG